jgi:hypothetical protein
MIATTSVCPEWCAGHDDLLPGELVEGHAGAETVLFEFAEASASPWAANRATIARSAGPDAADGYDVWVAFDSHVDPAQLAGVADELEALAARLRSLGRWAQ